VVRLQSTRQRRRAVLARQMRQRTAHRKRETLMRYIALIAFLLVLGAFVGLCWLIGALLASFKGEGWER
jgi:hypothetical protein